MVGITLFLVALLAVAAIRPARAAQGINVSVPVSGILTNACNGEEVVLSGAIHVRKRTTRGDYHISLTENGQHLTGVGLVTGATYQVPAHVHLTVNTTRAASELVFVELVNFVGQGDVPNFTSIIRVHLTVNANGEVINISNDLETFCR
jgi:hypothetical protein